MNQATIREAVAEAVATKGRRSKKAKAEWRQPEHEHFAHGTVLAFDQSLTKTGLAVITNDYSGLRIIEGSLIKPGFDELGGFEQTFARALRLDTIFSEIIMVFADRIDVVVHEMPAVAGYRVESSLMSAHCIRAAAHRNRVRVAMVSNQHMASILVAPENRKGGKKSITESVERLIPRENRQTKRWNQDVHDAVGLGLTYLYDKEVQRERAAG